MARPPASIFDGLPMPPVAKTLGWTLLAVSLGKSIAFIEAELFDVDGELVAKSTATARVLKASALLGN